ncbi:MAG: ComEC/Rec2 family competence protein, partial [Myxococcota bacterium]
VVVSHPHPDHYGGLVPVLASIEVARVRAPRAARAGEDDYAALLAGHRVEVAARDPPLVLHPRPGWASPARDPVNDESLVVRVDHGRRRFLFPGDVEAAGEAALLDEDVRADVLKVPHHGSRTSSSPALVARVAPEVAVVSCGAGNTYGHPHPRALAAYRGTRLYRTDRDGNVVVRTDGERLDVTTTERPERWRLSD